MRAEDGPVRLSMTARGLVSREKGDVIDGMRGELLISKVGSPPAE